MVQIPDHPLIREAERTGYPGTACVPVRRVRRDGGAERDGRGAAGGGHRGGAAEGLAHGRA